MVAAWQSPAHAYIGPGAGFAVIGSFLVVVAAVVLSALVLVSWPLRAVVLYRRRRRAYARSQADRVVVLGLDGMDPNLVEEMMAAGRLPNLAEIRKTGAYRRLATTCPPMSPVAWSSFMTGAGPGRHGIFDFLRRDPRTYLPDLSSAEIRTGASTLNLGVCRLRRSRTSVRALRRSKPFWAVLGEHGIASTVLRVPITFPPEPFHGLLLSGMCVPDLRGTQGSFAFFTTADLGEAGYTGGERFRVQWSNGVARASLPGLPVRGKDGSEASASLPFSLLRQPNGVRLEIGGQRVLLRQGRFSEWIPVEFKLGRLRRASGICRFYLKRVEPELELYASPINIDPERPALPVSHPFVYSMYLAKRLGRYATLGLAEDTWALNEGVLDDDAFLDQCQLLFEERERMLFNALRNRSSGCVVCVFDTTDRVQHMFWRERAAGAGNGDRAGRAIEAAYEQADALVGRVASELGPRDVLIVLSDHGFTAFERGVNINAWLREHGYLALKPGATGEAEWLRDVDWARTRAYAIGLGGIYLNINGREANGVVSRAEAEAVKRELIGKLTGLRDEASGTTAIARVFDMKAECPGPYVGSGPDLTVGYAPGYRASWDGAQGKAAGPVIEDNTRHWSGDHCVDPKQVPGVLLCSRPLSGDGAAITDIAPSVLSLFGVAAPGYMQGRSLLLDG